MPRAAMPSARQGLGLPRDDVRIPVTRRLAGNEGPTDARRAQAYRTAPSGLSATDSTPWAGDRDPGTTTRAAALSDPFFALTRTIRAAPSLAPRLLPSPARLLNARERPSDDSEPRNGKTVGPPGVHRRARPFARLSSSTRSG